MNLSLQPATPSDIPHLLTMMESLYAADHIPFETARHRHALEALLADPQLGYPYLVKLDEERAGYVILTLGFSLEFAGRFALLDEIYIAEEYRGRGAGERVLRRIEEICRSMGIRAIRLEVEHANSGAQRLYKRLGFVPHERYLMTRWLVDG